ncbi:MAG: hypothetical protein C5B57_12575 [Blastocatellia bacterium]|nr:MAG: hypothetical protein C5B57_12575 [Blastocatellia bacterium]
MDVRVVPRARKNETIGARGGAMLIRLSAPPVEGAANAALIEFLSLKLHVPQRSIRIVGGEHARTKRVAIAGVSTATVAALLQA